MQTETSLTSPSDKTTDTISKKSVTHPSLTDEELSVAADELIIENLNKFRNIERRYADPILPGQVYSLHSFIPSKDARPDKDGIYGMIKIRGTFSTMEEANERAEEMIRNHDSYHKIYHGYVGKPMPLTEKSDWSQKVEEIDIQQKISKTVSEDVKAKRIHEKKQVQEIKERERKLQEDVEQEATDPYEKYTCLRVKKAQVIWGFMEHRSKLKEMRDVFDKTLKEIEEMDEEDDDYHKKYLDRYMDARKRAGIPEDKNDTSFMKYLNHDILDLDEYIKLEDERQKLAIENGEDSNYKISRTSGSTISVHKRT